MAGPVRQPIDLESLSRYVEKNVLEIKTPLKMKQFGFGQSNPTYLITGSDGGQFVMRKKPPGKLLSRTAHQVDREYRIIHALENTDVPVPKAYCLCEDDSVVGTPFYIMEFLDGRMVTEPHFPGVSPEERRALWKSAVQTLATFHRVDRHKVGLSSFGKSSNFYDRQIKTFSTLSPNQASAVDVETKQPVGPIPHFDDMVTFFRDKSRQPRDRTTLIHGDYKIDNLVFHKTEPRVIGILDWEMATVGHPLSDLVNLTGPYSWTAGVGLPGSDYNAGSRDTSTNAPRPDSQTKYRPSNPSTPQSSGSTGGKPEFSPGVTPGLPSLQEIVTWYSEASGYDPSTELGWGNAFGGFRGAVIMQGIAARYAVRQASGTTAKEYGKQMAPYGRWAYSLVERLMEEGGKAKL